ncbi:putative ventral nervous system defective [Operophtera brumata]|uniref:Putative ventral nervous system defective n=1 Tax=Operophtera brumata TaxID=104452 RepID=A0A0L7KM34_OPEBR|nr:putative ventral nervous system defective [Operophtera brumata]
MPAVCRVVDSILVLYALWFSDCKTIGMQYMRLACSAIKTLLRPTIKQNSNIVSGAVHRYSASIPSSAYSRTQASPSGASSPCGHTQRGRTPSYRQSASQGWSRHVFHGAAEPREPGTSSSPDGWKTVQGRTKAERLDLSSTARPLPAVCALVPGEEANLPLTVSEATHHLRPDHHNKGKYFSKGEVGTDFADTHALKTLCAVHKLSWYKTKRAVQEKGAHELSVGGLNSPRRVAVPVLVKDGRPCLGKPDGLPPLGMLPPYHQAMHHQPSVTGNGPQPNGCWW